MIGFFRDRENGRFVRTEVINREVRAAIVGTISDQVPWISSAMNNYANRLPIGCAIGKASMKRQPSRVGRTKEETPVTP